MGKSRLFVFQLKEIILTAFFVILGIVLIIVLINIFSSNSRNKITKENEQTLNSGIYTSQLSLNNLCLNVEVTVDNGMVNSVAISNLSESITTMYPLIEDSIESINTQLKNKVPVESLVLDSSSRYTEQLIVESIENALDKGINSSLQ